MTESDVRQVLDALAGLRLWLDGGWGIDALLGEQTREHSDLDAAIDRTDLDEAARRLRALGYEHMPGVEPGEPARYVMQLPLCGPRCSRRDCRTDSRVHLSAAPTPPSLRL